MCQATEFLKLLDPNCNRFLFAAYDYRKIKKGKQILRAYESARKELQEWNDDVFCVYVTINETKDKTRKKDNVKRCRAIWVEDDKERESPRDDWPLKPSIIVRSSGDESKGKYHYYWLTSTTKFDEWNMVMNTMVSEWGCDKQARDIVRVLRLPGYKHRKDLSKPWPVEMVEGNGNVYRWFELKKVFQPTEKASKEMKVSQKTSTKCVADYSESEEIEALLSSENYHGSLVSISMSLTNKGLSRELQYMTLYGLMQRIPKENRRKEWEHRISEEHLYECIDSAIEKKETETSQITTKDLKYFNLQPRKPPEVEFPPGRMGDLCREILEMAPYPNREIALAGGMSLVAGITGRTYNVLGMGLNLYIAILADSGIGKANLKDSINMALRAGGEKLNVGSSFIGRSRFTGPKAIFDMLSNGLSRICVIEEAGLISESTTGDVSGTTRVLLDLFTSSGYGKWAGDEGYSNQENSIPSIHSPALSLVNVSTPRSFLKALRSKSAEVSGEVARLWIMRSLGEKPYFNKDRRRDYSKEHIAILGKLITQGLSYQSPESELRVIDIEVPDHFFRYADEWVDRENEYLREGDHLRRTLCSRAWAKIMKMASIVSVYNGKTEVGKEEYEWATRCVEEELRGIASSFNYDLNEDIHELILRIVAPSIIKCLRGDYRTDKKNSPLELRSKNIFPSSCLNQILLNNSDIKSWNDHKRSSNYKSGLDKVFAYMVSKGYLILIDRKCMQKYGSRSRQGYQLTEEFESLFDN